jgi:hypothetical protein
MTSKNSNAEPKAKKPTKGVNSAVRLRLSKPGYSKAATSRKPEAVVKIMSQARGYTAKKLMEYVARTEDEKKEELALEDETGVEHLGKHEIQKIYDEWKEDFDEGKPGSKRPPRHVTHAMLSANCEVTQENERKVLQAARETLQEELSKKGYDYLLVLHKDGARPHCHAVIKNSNRDPDGPKLRLNPPELLELRQKFAEKLSQLGIEQVATLRQDRPHIMERIAKGVERLHESQNIYQTKLAQDNPSVDVLKVRRQAAQTITRLREEVRKETFSMGTERVQLLKDLRQTERKLMDGRDVKKEIEATVKKFGKDIEGIQRDRADGRELPTAKDRLKRSRTLDTFAKNITKNMEDARKEIQKAPIPEQDRRQALQGLKDHEKALEKSLGRGRGR